jgi:hypothetical protein
MYGPPPVRKAKMYGPPPVRKAKMERGDMNSLHQCIRPLGSLAWAMMEMRAPRSS